MGMVGRRGIGGGGGGGEVEVGEQRSLVEESGRRDVDVMVGRGGGRERGEGGGAL